VRSRIIDGERWLAERLRVLRQRLTEQLSDDQRTAVEAEIEALSQERGLTVGGHRMPGLFRLRRRKQ
jgi:hypothetical protein